MDGSTVDSRMDARTLGFLFHVWIFFFFLLWTIYRCFLDTDLPQGDEMRISFALFISMPLCCLTRCFLSCYPCRRMLAALAIIAFAIPIAFLSMLCCYLVDDFVFSSLTTFPLLPRTLHSSMLVVFFCSAMPLTLSFFLSLCVDDFLTCPLCCICPCICRYICFIISLCICPHICAFPHCLPVRLLLFCIR